MSIRNKILKAGLGNEIVVLPLPDGEVKVEVRAKTVAQQYDLIERGGEGKNLAVETIIATVYDPDTGDPVFEPADRDYLLNEVNASLFQLLLIAANRAAGFTPEAEVEADLKETSPDETPTS